MLNPFKRSSRFGSIPVVLLPSMPGASPFVRRPQMTMAISGMSPLGLPIPLMAIGLPSYGLSRLGAGNALPTTIRLAVSPRSCHAPIPLRAWTGADRLANTLDRFGLGMPGSITIDYSRKSPSALRFVVSVRVGDGRSGSDVDRVTVYVGLDDPRLRLSRFSFSSMAWRIQMARGVAARIASMACAMSRGIFNSMTKPNGLRPGFFLSAIFFYIACTFFACKPR